MFQVNVFHMVYYIGDTAKRTSMFLIRILFVANAKYVLRVLINKGNLHGYRGRTGI
jgi:hypothetical protein